MVKEIRRQLSISQEDLARELGTGTYVANAVRGNIPPMLLAGGAAYFAGLDDLYAVVTTLLGAGIGIAVARVRLRRGGCLQRMTPRVAGRLSTAAE